MKIKDRVKPKLPPVEPGVYMAVCVGVVDLGEQYSEVYKSYSNKVKFIWALPSETIEVDGKQEERQLSREFSVATKKTSKLRSFLCGWNGKNYSDEEYMELDMLDQLGKPCQLNVVLSDSGEYANVDSVMPIPKGFPAPVSKTELFAWDMDQWDDDAFERLPEWVRGQIQKSTQYQKDHAPREEIRAGDGAGDRHVAVAPREDRVTGGAPF
jgi:hypothetical protein